MLRTILMGHGVHALAGRVLAGSSAIARSNAGNASTPRFDQQQGCKSLRDIRHGHGIKVSTLGPFHSMLLQGYNAAISACASSSEWQNALDLLQSLQSSRNPLDAADPDLDGSDGTFFDASSIMSKAISFSSVISAFDSNSA